MTIRVKNEENKIIKNNMGYMSDSEELSNDKEEDEAITHNKKG